MTTFYKRIARKAQSTQYRLPIINYVLTIGNNRQNIMGQIKKKARDP